MKNATRIYLTKRHEIASLMYSGMLNTYKGSEMGYGYIGEDNQDVPQRYRNAGYFCAWVALEADGNALNIVGA